MSADIVQARYTELEGVAGRFAGAGERVQEVARGVQGRADVLRRGGWEGHGQAAFLAELDALVLPTLGRLVAALAEARDVTQQMRQAIQLAEEEAARLFEVNGAVLAANTTDAVAVGEYVNKTTPSAASLGGVIDTRPPWKQWLGDNTPAAFVPGFIPPVGGDIETIDDRLQKKFGRDVNLVDGNEKWTEYEAAAIDRAVANLPPSLAALSTIRNFYRNQSQGSGTLAFWVPPTYAGNDAGVYEQQSITFMSPVPLLVTRQGSTEAGARVETVVFHELVHSTQFTGDGQLTDLTQGYLNHFGWTYNSNEWQYDGSKGPFPGDTDRFWVIPVGYPKRGQNGLEDMAEAITYYRYEPETLKRESPERYAWVRDHVYGGQEYLTPKGG